MELSIFLLNTLAAWIVFKSPRWLVDSEHSCRIPHWSAAFLKLAKLGVALAHLASDLPRFCSSKSSQVSEQIQGLYSGGSNPFVLVHGL